MTKKILLILCSMATWLAFGFSQNVMASTATQQPHCQNCSSTQGSSDESVSSDSNSFDNNDFDDSEDFGDEPSDQLPESSPPQSSNQTPAQNSSVDED